MANKELKIKLAADATELQSGFKQAMRATQDLGGEVSRFARGAGIELTTSLQKNVAQLQILRDHLIKTEAPAADVAKATQRLAEEQRKLDAALKESSASSGKFSGFMQQHGAAIAGTLTAIGGAAIAFGQQSVTAFEESEIALAQLNNVIASTGGVAGVTADEVLTMSAAIQKSTGISDEATTTAQSMLLSFTKIGKDVFPEVTHAVADMATFMNKGAVPSMEQMSQTAIQIGKAMQDPVEGVSALQRVGVRLSDSQKDLVKSLVETGRTAEAQRVILAELKKEFGGAAEAAGKTFRGQVKIAREEMNDFQEDVGGKIVPVLQSLMHDFPDAAKGAIFLGDSIGGLNIRAGDLLVALPLMKTAFGGLGLSNIASGFSGITSAIGLFNPVTLAAAAGLGAFLVAYAKISEEKAVNAQLKESIDLMQQFSDMGKAAGVSAGVSAEGLRAMRAQAAILATDLKETRTEAEIFAELVKKATAEGVKPLTGEIKLWATAQQGVTKALDYSRPSLAAQITALEKEIATMKKSGAEKELVWKAEDRLAEMKKKLTSQTKELVSQIEKEAKAALGKIPALESEIKLSAKYIAGLEREVKLHPENTRLVALLTAAKAQQLANIKELNTLLDQEIVLTDKYGNVTRTTTLEIHRFIEATKDLDKVMTFTYGTLEAAMKTSADLGTLFRTQLPADFGKPKTALIDLDSAFKTLGITSSAVLQTQVTETRAAYDSIIAKYGEASREGQLAWAAMAQSQIDATRHAGGKIDEETQRAVNAIKAHYGDLKNDKNANLTNWRELASKQVSTVVTDFSKGFVDILFSAGSFGGKLVGLFSQIGQSVSRAWIETGVMGILSGQGIKGFSVFGGGLLDAVQGKGTGKAGLSLAGFAPNAAKLLGFGKAAGTTALSAAGGLTLGSTALMPGVAAALPTTFANTALMTPTLGGAAGASSTMASLGAFMTNPWTIGIAASIAGGILLTKKFTQRGRDKTTATGSADPSNLSGAEGLSYEVWQEIIPDVKAGNRTIDEGIADVKAAWVKYEQFLRANVKDSVVIQRSLDTQRATLTQSLAELEEMKKTIGSEGIASVRGFLDEMEKTGEVTDDAIQGLKNVAAEMEGAGLAAETNAAKLGVLGAEFFKTGTMTDSFSSALNAAGGSADFFAKMTGAIQKLQGLRQEFGALKQMVDSLIPPTKTWQEEFFETGNLTSAVAAKIRAAGGDIEQFQKFADTRKTQTRFQQLVAEFNKTGIASKELLKMIREFGSPATLRSFLNLEAESKRTGKTIGELARESEDTAKAVQDAFGNTSEGIEKAFASAAQSLSDTLGKMDENLGKSIQSLQNAMVTMIKDLIDVLLGVPGAAEKAAKDANFFLGTINNKDVTITVKTNLDDAGLTELENRLARLDLTATGQLKKFTDAPEGATRDKGFKMALGGVITAPMFLVDAKTGRTAGMIGEAGPEAVLPMRLANYTIPPQVVASFNRAESGRGGSTSIDNSRQNTSTVNAPKVEQNIVFNHVSDDEYAQRKMMERVNQNLVDLLARGG